MDNIPDIQIKTRKKKEIEIKVSLLTDKELLELNTLFRQAFQLMNSKSNLVK